ncbi:MAG: lamin tail domain-containing protein [Verrucomicrobiota bacterium]
MISPAQELVVTNKADWRWRKATNEVSTPVTAWRTNGFNDVSWPLSNAPFHYGTAFGGGDDNLTGGTILADMSGGYRGIFLRRTFTITNVAEIGTVQLVANYDDGFIAWINGTEIARTNVLGQPTYLTNATASIEPARTNTFAVIPLPSSYLVPGVNTLAVQAFNSTLTGSDFRFDAALQISKLTPPTIATVTPTAGSTVGGLTQITVIFSRTVNGVTPADFLVNNQPAVNVIGNDGTNTFTFLFTQPLPGTVQIKWDDLHDIVDAASGAPFDENASGASWTYQLTDAVAPVVGERIPVPAAQVGKLTQTEITFSEPVTGVNAADLLINGSPATNVIGSGAGPYVFQFTQPAAGSVVFNWAAGHGIQDLADVPNDFAGGAWFVSLDSGAAAGDVVINEFLAGNIAGLLDEDGEAQDWIELYNRGSNTVNLLGWSLTDDDQVPSKWIFPSTNLAPGQFLVVFASEKNRRTPANPLHANFKLNLFGDHLALFNAESPQVPVSEFTPKFPEQRNDYSYGRDGLNVWRYYRTPTPGAANGSSTILGIAPEPHFSVSRGVFSAPFNLLLTTTLPGAVMRYTTDGTDPTEVNGLSYNGPITISNTLVLRAATFLSGYLPSRVQTHSYIFADQVLNQPAYPAGFPADWGVRFGFGFSNNLVPADYEMDLDPLRVTPTNPASPVDAAKLQRFKTGLAELPVVSIVMNVEDMFGATGIYNAANVMTKGYPDRPCSIEMVLPDGSTAFAETCGIGIHGNASRQPEKNPKHGFKIVFKGEFGETKLKYQLFPESPVKEFDDLILRADFGVSWRHWSDVNGNVNGSFQRTRASRFRDAWMKEAARDLEVAASHTRFCNLFINGLYWGTYDFSEQPKSQFAAGLLGGTTEDYDIYEQGDAIGGYVEGTPPGGSVASYNTFQKLLALPNATTSAGYEAFKQYLDVTEYIDYCFLHFFVGHRDWGTAKNWYAIRQRAGGTFVGEGKFKFVPWDGECVLLNPDNSDNRIPDSGGGNSNESQSTAGGLHAKLKINPQYRLDFADRVFKHMLAPDGALTSAANSTRWLKWQGVLDNAITAESVRWGDYRRDAHPYLEGDLTQLYTRENHWLAENSRMLTNYFPGRATNVLGWLRTAGLYPAIDAPEFHKDTTNGVLLGSMRVASGFVLAMRNPGAGTIYYTTNGSDPRVEYTGAVAGSALTNPATLTLNATVTLKARVLNGGTWSALNEATFTTGELGVPLRITELMYNPVGGSQYEFLELQNVGGQPLDLGGFSFTGITFNFPGGTLLAPGAILLLANNANPAQFASRYPGVAVFGNYSGNLDNGGERIAILDPNGYVVTAVNYDDENGWPTSPDGGGYSLEVIDPRGDPNSPANWRASSAANGTPGLPPVAPPLGDVILNEVAADNLASVNNGGTFPDWVELYNRGTNPVSLANWSLTDGGNARKFVFPATNLPAGGYLVVWCDTATNLPGWHTGFALGRTGENVLLYDASTNRVDALSFGLQISDLTLGRIADQWQLTQPTPGAANLAVTLGSSTNVAINEWLANPSAGTTNWIELFNRSATLPVALRGLYLGTSNTVFQIRAHSFLPPRGFMQLFGDQLPGAGHLEFALPTANNAIILSDVSGTELERVTYGVQTAGVTRGRLPDGSASFTVFPGSPSPGASNYLASWTGPVLNEILARNATSELSPWSAYSDWVELSNPSNVVVSLAGLALGKSTATSGRWTFPAGATIPANGFLRVWCDSSQPASTISGPVLNTGFSLSSDSGDVFLFNLAGQVVDSVGYGFQARDLSIGRDAGPWKLLAAPTPAAVNSAPAALGPVSSLRLNEWMAAPLSGNDWFELFNPGALPVELSGLYLADNPSTVGITNFQIAPLSFIGGRSWVLWQADGDVAQGRDHVDFSLGKLGETLRIYDASLALIDAVDFGIQPDGISQGRLPDGGNTLVSFSTTPTPDAANFIPLSGAASLLPNGQIQLSFTVESNLTYQVEYKTDLADTAWLPLGAPVYATGGTLILTDPATAAQRFYRLALP